MDVTTIKLDKATKKRLDKLKIHKRETYDEVLQRILGILNLCVENPMGAKIKLARIHKTRKELGL